jgi:MraZ protein
VQRFVGKFLNKLDAKGRVSIPAKFREVLHTEGLKGFYCSPSALKPNLTGCGESFFARIDSTLAGLNPYSPEYAAQSMQAFGDASYLEFDAEGRVRLLDELIAHAEIQEQVQFVGHGVYFELWNPETFPAARAERIEILRQDMQRKPPQP